MRRLCPQQVPDIQLFPEQFHGPVRIACDVVVDAPLLGEKADRLLSVCDTLLPGCEGGLGDFHLRTGGHAEA